MDRILPEQLEPLFNLFPIKIGNTELTFNIDGNRKYWRLIHNGSPWMGLTINNFYEIRDQYIEINLAKGKVVTTGLGLGLRETWLSLKKEVEQVIVFENNKDVIDIFYQLTNQSNFNTEKIKIVHGDAEDAKKINSDWLILDHYETEHQTYWEIIDNVRLFSNNCNAKHLFFWPFLEIFMQFSEKKRINPTEQSSYLLLLQYLKIDKMPNHIDQELLEKIPYIAQL